MGPTTDLRAAELRLIRAEDLGIGLKCPKQFRFRRFALRKPPPMLHIDHAGVKDIGQVCLRTAELYLEKRLITFNPINCH